MSRNPAGQRDYNGLKNKIPAFGGQVHEIGGKDRNTAVQAAFNQQMQALMREIYCRAAAEMMKEDPAAVDGPTAELYRTLAQQCQIAALAYFEGLGLIRKPEPTDEPESGESA